MKSNVFFVSLRTPEKYSEEEYNIQAGKMLNVLQSVLHDVDKMYMMLGKSKAESVHTEAEVSQDEEGLVGKAIVDVKAESKVTLDKSKLSSFLKSQAPWDTVKVEKRSVQVDSE